MKAMEPQLVELALKMSAKIIGRDLERDPMVVAEIAATAIETARASKAMILRVNPKDGATLRGAKPKLIRTFKIATGRSEYPTPLGKFEVINKQANPWWYPPPGSDWAKDAKPVPPGPGNPLGTRWMGLSSPYVGIHGTPDAASIGYSASHGCIRMLIPQVEWLFTQIELGTPVFIVAA